jgi:hypothetical protein
MSNAQGLGRPELDRRARSYRDLVCRDGGVAGATRSLELRLLLRVPPSCCLASGWPGALVSPDVLSEFPHLLSSSPSAEAPSIIAHSFGTYILGTALLRYPYLRFSKVIRCSTILLTDSHSESFERTHMHSR